MDYVLSFYTSLLDPEKELDSFLNDQKGILLTSHSMFKGSEAEDVVSIQYSNVTSSNVRGTLLRSVSRLYMLMGLDETTAYKIGSTINDNSLLRCHKNCNAFIWECLDCSQNKKNKIMICLPCTKTCHKNHKIEIRYIQSDGIFTNVDGKCRCSNHHRK